MNRFLDEQCLDVGWTYSAADLNTVDQLTLNYTTHNLKTKMVLDCIDSLTGHLPLIPPPCPNSGAQRNSTKYHLRCPDGWGANTKLMCGRVVLLNCKI